MSSLVDLVKRFVLTLVSDIPGWPLLLFILLFSFLLLLLFHSQTKCSPP